MRAILWAAHSEEELDSNLFTDNPEVEVGWYPGSNHAFIYNNSPETQAAHLQGMTFDLAGYASRWVSL